MGAQLQGATRIQDREKWMHDLRSGVASLQDCPLKIQKDYEVVLQACSSADENKRMKSLQLAGGINEDWKNDEWLKIAAGVEEEKPPQLWKICVSKKYALTKNASTFSLHVIVHMKKHPTFQGLQMYNPDFYDKGFCLARDTDGEIDWDRVTDASYPCRGGATCRRPVLFEGRRPTTGSCWRYSYQWHVEKTKYNKGFLLQIVELVEGILKLGDGQMIEEEMAIEAEIGILRIEQKVSEGVTEAVDKLAQRYTKAVEDGQWDKGFNQARAFTWLANELRKQESELTSHLAQLQTLSLINRSAEFPFDVIVKELAQNCANLEMIWLSNTKVTDAGVQELAKNCRNLTHIYLLGTQVTDASVQELAEKIPGEFLLYLSDDHPAYKARSDWKKKHPKMTIL